MRKGEYNEARSLFQKALSVFQQTEDPKNIANALHYLGMVNSGQSNYKAALKYFLEAVDLAEKSNVKKLLSQLYFKDLSELYEHIGRLSKSLEFTQKHEEVKDNLWILKN